MENIQCTICNLDCLQERDKQWHLVSHKPICSGCLKSCAIMYVKFGKDIEHSQLSMDVEDKQIDEEY